MEKFGVHYFEVVFVTTNYWIYKIYARKPGEYIKEIIDSVKYFKTEQEARCEAMEHIGLLEKEGA